MRGRRFLTLACGSAMLMALSGAGLAHASGTTKQVSVTGGGEDPVPASTDASISADGRYVAFASKASDLVPGDGNGVWDVFVRDLVTGTTVRASVDTLGGDADGGSYRPSISADGTHVAFDSDASDLVAQDGNDRRDVFLRDLVAGTTIRVSVDTQGGDANGDSGSPSVNADGRYVAFESYASDLFPGDDDGSDVFVRDTMTGTTERASVAFDGGNPDGGAFRASIDAAGRRVAFFSFAEDLVEEDDNGEDDIFVRDFASGETRLVSVASNGFQTDDISDNPSISADGRFVAFESYASVLVNRDQNGETDIFVHDLLTRTTIRASIGTSGREANGFSTSPSISADGRFVAFQSFASNLVRDDGNGLYDVFVRDLDTGVTIRVSLDASGRDPNGASTFVSISSHGGSVAYQSLASDLVQGSSDHHEDVFATRVAF